MVRSPPCPISTSLQEEILTSSEMDNEWSSVKVAVVQYIFISIIHWD